MGYLYQDDELIGMLVTMVTGRQNEGISLEQILAESGMAGVSIYSRVETRAKVLYCLGLALTPHGQLEDALVDFIADHVVFRWSELRYRFKSDAELEIEALLHQLNYTSRYMEQEQEYVWAPKRMWATTINKLLQGRQPLGDQAYFEYLSNKLSRRAHYAL
ncbi:hypothetical protein [Thalassomonas haliotis]|uniref:Uncharacterized protein n=1 Tax=Thalassomonas haliotis TaxID=485448 RepID=A0ABY7VGF9_9GAMM|nr:hypothetical protein [Thalassomonas haliotis]WDE11757.1 hypothetical protein H3N35_26790 [Thalassomonas haliotis]